MAALYGFPSPEELLRIVTDMASQIYVRPEDLSRLFQLLETSDAVHDFESRHKQRDGTAFWTSQAIYVIRDHREGIRHFQGFVTDISRHKETVEALQKSEERVSKAFASSPAPLVISEMTTGKFIDVNARWIDMLGYGREELIGKSSKDVGIWVDPGERDRLVRRLRIHGPFKDEPVAFKAKSGRTVRALWSAEAITLGGQDVMLSFLYDETERRRAEELLRQSEERFAQLFRLSRRTSP
jgi:PAS domain S-box-containing protein